MVMTPQQLAEIEALAGNVPDTEPAETRPREIPKARAHSVEENKPTTFVQPVSSAGRSVQEEFKLQKGIPKTVNTPRLTWPFKDMEVGHWFTVTNEENFQRARVSASSYGKRNGTRFTCKRDGNNHLIVQRVK